MAPNRYPYEKEHKIIRLDCPLGCEWRKLAQYVNVGSALMEHVSVCPMLPKDWPPDYHFTVYLWNGVSGVGSHEYNMTC